jgi:hypothetical protein
LIYSWCSVFEVENMQRVELVCVLCVFFVFVTYAYFTVVASAVAIHYIKKLTTHPCIPSQAKMTGRCGWTISSLTSAGAPRIPLVIFILSPHFLFAGNNLFYFTLSLCSSLFPLHVLNHSIDARLSSSLLSPSLQLLEHLFSLPNETQTLFLTSDGLRAST